MTALPALPTTWLLDGLSFNVGDDADGFGRIITSSEGWDGSASGNPQLIKRSAAHGSYRGPNYRGNKVVELVGYAQAPTPARRIEEAERLAGLLLDPNTLFALTCSGFGINRTLWVELNSTIDVSKVRDGLTLKFNLQVVASDPRKYSPANATVSTGLAVDASGGIRWNGTATAGTGTEWNARRTAPSGLVYQQTGGTSGMLTLTNAGTEWAPIAFALVVDPAGKAINPTMTCNQTGEKITFGETVPGGSTLTINTGTGATKLDGSDRGGSLTRAEFFSVPPHSSIDVTFTADAGSSLSTLSATNANAYI